jgi:hypothetical protein
MTFNSIILNSISSEGIERQNIKNGMVCILGKRAVNELLEKIAGYTIILTKWELEDDKRDNASIRSGAARLALGRAIRKAERIYAEYDEQVAKGFEILMRMESEGCTDAVRIGRTFSETLMPAMRDIAGDTWNKDLEDLLIGMGTMIYVIDAVDDIDEDIRNGTFNPFLAGYECPPGKDEFIRDEVYKITDMTHNIMKDIQTSYSSIRGSMRFHKGIGDNVIFHGIPDSVKRVLCGPPSSHGLRNAISSRTLRTGGR